MTGAEGHSRTLLVTRVLALLLCARVLLRFYSLEQVVRWFLPARSARRRDINIEVLLEAVEAASWRFPALHSCLPRSLVICRILRKAGIDAELRLGANTKVTPFEAHAWVEDAKGRRFDRPGVDASDFARFNDV